MSPVPGKDSDCMEVGGEWVHKESMQLLFPLPPGSHSKPPVYKIWPIAFIVLLAALEPKGLIIATDGTKHNIN